MKSLKEQIANKCIHFNGVMNASCKAGVNYADVRVDKPYRFPCLKQGGECSKSIFRTEEEVEAHIKKIKEDDTKVIQSLIAVKVHYAETKEPTGKVPCQCGGELSYSVSSVNGHVWAKCNSCNMSFNE